jgi:hypothetical protein
VANRDEERVVSLSLPLSASEGSRVSSLAGFVVALMSVMEERPPDAAQYVAPLSSLNGRPERLL